MSRNLFGPHEGKGGAEWDTVGGWQSCECQGGQNTQGHWRHGFRHG